MASNTFTGMQLGYQPLSPGKTLFPQWTGASSSQGATLDTFITDHQLPPENTVPYEDHGEHVPAYRLAPNETGFWFSHPASAECPESMAVGSVLPSGQRCTWKRMSQMRVLRGEDLVKVLRDPGDRSDLQRYLRIMRGNIRAARQLLDDMPLAPWTCGNGGRQFPPPR